jgi:hypothetical protein
MNSEQKKNICRTPDFWRTVVSYALVATIGLLVSGCPQAVGDEPDIIEPLRYTISFDSHGGSAVEPVTADESTPVAKPADPERDGLTFQGWFDAEVKGSLYSWPHTLSASVTMHAQWAATTTVMDVGELLDPKAGVWYSYYEKNRLDGYTIGQWKDVKTLLGEEKIKLFGRIFPLFDFEKPRFKPLGGEGAAEGVPAVGDDEYFIFYDDTVYGEETDGSGDGGWGFGYMGIVRAVNVFYDTKDHGAIIIEYLDGCYPEWSETVLETPLPFFGIYYRVLQPDIIQIANPVMLANLSAGLPYHTETATLKEAIAKNNAENDGEFVNWGVVIPQDRSSEQGKTIEG